MNKENQKIKGQVLVEVMVAMSIMVIGLMGVLALLNQAFGLSGVVSDQFTATFLAQEGIEVMRNIVDANVQNHNGIWNKGFSVNEGPCFEIDYLTAAPSLSSHYIGDETRDDCSLRGGKPLRFDAANNKYSYDLVGTPTQFYRTIEISYPPDMLTGEYAGEQIQVNSIVSWISRGGGDYTVNLEDHFYKWNP